MMDSTREGMNDSYVGGNLSTIQTNAHLKLGSEKGGRIDDSNMLAMGPLDTGYG